MRVLIVTALDQAYFELGQSAILSIRDKRQGRDLDLALFDLGCTASQRKWFGPRVNRIVEPNWEFDFPTQTTCASYLRGLFARPFLRRYFPGYDVYVWIDADAWIQDWEAIDLLVLGAVRRGMAVVPEIDRNYGLAYGNLTKYWQFVRRDYANVFNQEIADQFYTHPTINAGVFAIRSETPHWQAWEQTLRQGAAKHAGLMTDQVSLNLAIYGQLFDRTEILPAWCNWSCNFGLPSWDEDRQLFVEPSLPHHTIGIVHLTGPKHEMVQLNTIESGRVERSLRYVSQTASASAPPSPNAGFATSEFRLGDYASPGLQRVELDSAFPNMIVGDPHNHTWQYLRREIPHNWYVDRRAPQVGFLSRDEALLLYNNALFFQGQPALEIGCWVGWSACHLALAGVVLDVIDPLLNQSEFRNTITASLKVTGVRHPVVLCPGTSPEKVHELAEQSKRWSLLFIDGNHDAPYPLHDAKTCEPYAKSDAMILFHDLTSPDVSQGLDYLQDRGWNTMIYQTMQIMGVAWRGNVIPVEHFPDPSVMWPVTDHLHRHPFSGWQQHPDYAGDKSEFDRLLGVIRPFTLLGERRLTSLYTLARYVCQQDLPGNFVECGTYRGGAAALIAYIIKTYSRRPRKVYCFDTFKGMPEPTAHDTHKGIAANNTGFGVGTLAAPVEEYLEVVCRQLQVEHLVEAVPGLFAETLPVHKKQIGEIALLHADGDWYSSTMDIFHNMFDQVISGGFIQIDDYGHWEGCKQAVHEFEEMRQQNFQLNPIDYTGAWMRKS